MTANPTYTTGTVTVANGATTVTGIGTIWSGVNARPGDTIYIGTQGGVKIKDITDTTHLTLWAPWAPATQTSAAYTIVQDYPARVTGVAAAEDVGTMLAALKTQGFFFFVDSTDTEPDPSFGADGQYALQPTTGEVWLKIGGLWVSQGVFGNLSATATPWSSATTYTANIIVPFAGKLWRSLVGSNLNHQPDISPTQWALFLSGGDAYDIVAFDTDRPADAELVLKVALTKNVTFFAGLSDSRAQASVGATSTAVYHFFKNGVSFATLTFAAAGSGGPQTGTFAAATDTVFAPGDVLTVTAPSTRDASLASIGWTLSGYRT